MNKTNLRRLIDHLKSIEPIRFNMNNWVTKTPQDAVVHYSLDHMPEHTCGTAGCIAGHIWIGFKDELFSGCSIESAATEWLEISIEDATDLFFGRWSNRLPDQALSDLTLKQAIEHLEGLL